MSNNEEPDTSEIDKYFALDHRGRDCHGVMQGINTWRMEGIFTDITIRCHDGKEFKVHKIVVCPQSRFFHNAFKPGSLSKEAQTGVIELTEDPRLVQALVDHFYMGDYRGHDWIGNWKASNASQLVAARYASFDACCYAMADKYEVPDMKEFAKNRVALAVPKHELWSKCNGFPDLVEYVYENTRDSDRGLRDVILDNCTKHIKGLMLNRKFLEVADSIDCFWREYARHQAGLPQAPPALFQCPDCDVSWPMHISKATHDSDNISCLACFASKLLSEWKNFILSPPADVDEWPEDLNCEHQGAVLTTAMLKAGRVVAGEKAEAGCSYSRVAGKKRPRNQMVVHGA